MSATVACPGCGASAPPGSRFCGNCGTALSRFCPTCRLPVADFRFCTVCGSAVVEELPSAGVGLLPVSERRLTSVLFADLVGFTSLAESRDPEDVRELLSTYFAAARTVVARYGGTIEKFIGDAVMAVWGAPVAHEDDPERAVRAGLDLVSEVVAFGASIGAPGLAVRVGVVTGSVAVTLGAVNEGLVAGDPVNTASRVQGAAAPGTVWVDEDTRRLTSAAVAYTDMGEHELKGKAAPVRLYRADAVVAAVGGAQRVDGLEAPMVGRDHELRLVRDLLHATEADGRARLAVVTGVAGLGKSRLSWEFEKYVDGLTDSVRWHRGRSLAYGDGVAFWALAEMIRYRLEVLETDDAVAVEEKLRAGVTTVAASPSEAAWLTPRIAALLGIGERPGYDRTDLFASWTTFLERVGGDDPLVLVFEDSQYADSGLLDFVEHLLNTCRARLLVVLLTRPELLEARPALATGRRVSVVDLGPLDDDAMARLVDGLVDELPARARAAVVARADGVPLYAVETVRSLVDRGAVVPVGDRHVFVDHDRVRVDMDQLEAPGSLQGLIAARLDQLGPVERRIVQDASVLGVSFHADGLAKLSGFDTDQVGSALVALVRKDVLGRESDPRSPEAGQYRFLQAMVREVAYSTLARRDRHARHLAAAVQLEGDELADEVAGIVAQHLIDAVATGRPDDPDRLGLMARARSFLLVAAIRAAALGAPAEALRACETALGLEPDTGEQADMWLRAARGALAAGYHQRAGEHADAATQAFIELGRPGDAAAAQLAAAYASSRLGHRAETVAAVGRVLELLDSAGEDTPDRVATRVDATILVGSQRRWSRPDEAADTVELIRAAALAETLDDKSSLLAALNNLAVLVWDMGSSTTYLALIDRVARIAREGHHLVDLGLALANTCTVIYQDDLESAADLAAEGVDVCRRAGDETFTDFALGSAGFVWWLRGDWDQLEREVGRSLEDREPSPSERGPRATLSLVRRARGETVVAAPPLALEDPWDRLAGAVGDAVARADAGDVVGAAAAVAAVVRDVVRDSDVYDDFEILGSTAVELQLEAGDLVSAGELLALADGRSGRVITRAVVPRLRGLLELARGEDPEASLREAEAALMAYGAPFLLARTRLDLGRWLHGQGRPQDALPVLDLARAAFVELRAAPSIVEVDAVLGASAPA